MKKEKLIIIGFVVVAFVCSIALVIFPKPGKEINEVRRPTGAEPGGLVLSQEECTARGGRVADTTKRETCVNDEKAISAVTGFLAPALCCVSESGAVTTKKETEKTMTEQEARAVSEKTEACVKEGGIGDLEGYNENSKTWWFSILSPRSDCRPACVVSDDTASAEINWRCMGLVEPKVRGQE